MIKWPSRAEAFDKCKSRLLYYILSAMNLIPITQLGKEYSTSHGQRKQLKTGFLAFHGGIGSSVLPTHLNLTGPKVETQCSMKIQNEEGYQQSFHQETQHAAESIPCWKHRTSFFCFWCNTWCGGRLIGGEYRWFGDLVGWYPLEWGAFMRSGAAASLW